MRIESLGLPGSGKSTLVKSCHASLRADGHVACNVAELTLLDRDNSPSMGLLWNRTRIREAFHMARYVDWYPQAHAWLMQAYRDRSRNIALAAAVGSDLSKHRLHRDRLHSFWVDEGFLHTGVFAALHLSKWAHAPARDHLIAFLRVAPPPDVVVVTQLSWEVARPALLARFQSQGAHENEAWRRYIDHFGGDRGMQARAQLIDDALEYLRRSGIRLIELQGHGDLEVMTQDVLDSLC